VASEHAVPAIQLGETGGDRLKVDGAFDLEVAALRAAWEPET